MAIRLKAHAKLNLGLEISGRRGDGYHLIDTIFQEITLFDELEIELDDALRVECPGVPQEENTAYRAARVFFEASGVRGGAAIRVRKRIPSGAGLGGGSSDAAAVLKGLNWLHGMPLSQDMLAGLAVQVGADTPFFLAGGTQRARGIGEKLQPVPNRCRFLYLLVMPNGGVNTGEAYRLSDKKRPPAVDMARVEDALRRGDRDLFFRYAGNALMPAAERLEPEISHIRRACLEAGAEFSLMTGSGSCVFSVFQDRAVREKARVRLAERYPFAVCAEDCAGPSAHLRQYAVSDEQTDLLL